MAVEIFGGRDAGRVGLAGAAALEVFLSAGFWLVRALIRFSHLADGIPTFLQEFCNSAVETACVSAANAPNGERINKIIRAFFID
jgi:hypothetical protein